MDLQGRAWLESLTLEPHATLLRRLVARVEGEPAFRFVELCCSVARGAGDESSDLDLGIGIADDAWPEALSLVRPVLAGLGDVVDALEHGIPEWGDVPHRRFFVQYRDGVQVDLVASPASRRNGMPAGSVALYDADGHLATTFTSSLETATPEAVREWAFLAWVALANLDKYLRRGSAWEALEQLHEARTHVWRLWAVVCEARYPAFGLTSVLDMTDPRTPPDLEATVATLDFEDLRRAGLALAAILDDVSGRATEVSGATAPSAMAAFTTSRLTHGN
jgi:predicted nucleotidyltransferase